MTAEIRPTEITRQDFTGDALKRSYSIFQNEDTGDFYFDFLEYPKDFDPSALKFFRVQAKSIAEVEAAVRRVVFEEGSSTAAGPTAGKGDTTSGAAPSGGPPKPGSGSGSGSGSSPVVAAAARSDNDAWNASEAGLSEMTAELRAAAGLGPPSSSTATGSLRPRPVLLPYPGSASVGGPRPVLLPSPAARDASRLGVGSGTSSSSRPYRLLMPSNRRTAAESSTASAEPTVSGTEERRPGTFRRNENESSGNETTPVIGNLGSGSASGPLRIRGGTRKLKRKH